MLKFADAQRLLRQITEKTSARKKGTGQFCFPRESDPIDKICVPGRTHSVSKSGAVEVVAQMMISAARTAVSAGADFAGKPEFRKPSTKMLYVTGFCRPPVNGTGSVCGR